MSGLRSVLDGFDRRQLSLALTRIGSRYYGTYMALQNADLIIRLSHELGTALELSYDPVELREIWPEALDALADARQELLRAGLAVPPVVDNVLKISEHTS